jgi:hypothetical protein
MTGFVRSGVVVRYLVVAKQSVSVVENDMKLAPIAVFHRPSLLASSPVFELKAIIRVRRCNRMMQFVVVSPSLFFHVRVPHGSETLNHETLFSGEHCSIPVAKTKVRRRSRARPRRLLPARPIIRHHVFVHEIGSTSSTL